jgi:nucleotide-binding universal stress UspA family protein
MSETTTLGAREIAEALGAEVTLLHVVSDVALPYGGESPGEMPEHIKKLVEILSAGGVKLQVKVREGLVVSEILGECRQGGHDLLVLGQHLVDRSSGSALSENLAEMLALECPIPVIVVRPHRRGGRPEDRP